LKGKGKDGEREERFLSFPGGKKRSKPLQEKRRAVQGKTTSWGEEKKKS